MRTISKKTTKLFQTLTTIIMIAGLLLPPTTFAYAQDVVPPAPEAEQTAEPPSDAVELPVEQTVEPPADPAPVDPTTIELPAEQTVEAPTEAAPTEVFPLEQTVEVPAGLPTDQPAADGGAEEEAAPVESLAEIVEVLNETNTVLVDENDNVRFRWPQKMRRKCSKALILSSSRAHYISVTPPSEEPARVLFPLANVTK